ncbi:MAG TPA: TIGR02281 family clan AA aspartic protease [Devosiaceae bacterium]
MFIGIALLVAVGLALLIGADAGSMFGLTQDQTGRIVPLLLILIVIAGGMFSRRRKFSELFAGIVLWVGIFAVAIVGYTFRYELLGLSGRVFGELVPGIAVIDTEKGTATFHRGMGGHFQLEGTIDGKRITMIFDTGASAVVLTAEDAKAAGIDTENLSYTLPVSTANGTGQAASVVLDTIEVGGIVRHNVRAYVAEDGALETSLLGMTFLETLQRYAVSSNSLELTD